MNIDEQIPNFLDQSVAFYLRNVDGLPDWIADGVVLDSPVLRKIGDRIFVIGQTTYDPENPVMDDWTENREACLAWDSVVYYIAMPSKEYYAIRRREDAS